MAPLSPGTARTARTSGLDALDAARVLHSAGGALLNQAVLHGQLARVEWQQEKSRLLGMLAIALLGFACLLCTLLFAGAGVLALVWDTPYRLAAVAALVLLFGAGTAAAWRRFRAAVATGGEIFAASREELAADAAVLRASL